MMKRVLNLTVKLFLLVLMTACSSIDSSSLNESSVASQRSNLNKETVTSDSGSLGESSITIDFSFGEATGNYKGDMENGVPHGYGEFSCKSKDTILWTYKGNWRNGHMHGEGMTEWKDGRKNIGVYDNDVITPMSQIELDKVFSQPENYKDYYVELTGLIFNIIEYYNGGVAVQMYTDITNNDKDVVVYLQGSDISVTEDEMIRVKGTLGEVFEGENAFSAQLRVPSVTSNEYEMITYEDLYPIIAKKDVNQTQTQLGYSVTVQKVEITNLETRVYIRVNNNGTTKFDLYSFTSKIIQNNRQYENQPNYDADYPEIQTDLMPGVYTEGIITYPPLQEAPFKLVIEAGSDDWHEDIEDYIYEINFNEMVGSIPETEVGLIDNKTKDESSEYNTETMQSLENQDVTDLLSIAMETYPEFVDWTGGLRGLDVRDQPCTTFRAVSYELRTIYAVFVLDDGECYARWLMDLDEWIFYDSDRRYLTDEDLQYLSSQQLRFARNEIYARHGYIFESDELQSYFRNTMWYNPTIPTNQFIEESLNEVEKANIDKIKNFERNNVINPLSIAMETYPEFVDWSEGLRGTDVRDQPCTTFSAVSYELQGVYAVFVLDDGECYARWVMDFDEWIFYDSDRRYLTDEDLQYLSSQQLRLARNEIYARHGYMFESDDLQSYFMNTTWYNPTIPTGQFIEGSLNAVEKANVDKIKNLERNNK